MGRIAEYDLGLTEAPDRQAWGTVSPRRAGGRLPGERPGPRATENAGKEYHVLQNGRNVGGGRSHMRVSILSVAVVLLAHMMLGCGGTPDGSPSTAPPPSGTLAIPGGPVGTGPCTVQGGITSAGGEDVGTVLVNLLDASGDLVAETYATSDYRFTGVDPGDYRLALYTLDTGYIPQWYGGLPIQTNPVSNGAVLAVTPGVTQADFVLQPGRAITGSVKWSGAPRSGGWVWVFDADDREVEGHGASFDGESHEFFVIGLVPGRYKIGASVDDPMKGPTAWYGGATSVRQAALVDVTEAGVTGIEIDLGVVSPTTTGPAPPTTTP